MGIAPELVEMLIGEEDLSLAERRALLIAEEDYDTLVDAINHRAGGSSKISQISTETLGKWVKNGTMPVGYYPTFSNILGIEEKPHFAALFCVEVRKGIAKSLILNGNGDSTNGSFADFFTFIALSRDKKLEDLLPELGIYKSSFIGIVKGEVIPSDRMIEALCNKLELPEAAIPHAKTLARKDLIRFSPKKAFINEIMGDVDLDTTIGQVLYKLTAEGNYFSAAALGKKHPDFNAKTFWHLTQEVRRDKHPKADKPLVEKVDAMGRRLFPGNRANSKIIQDLVRRRKPRRNLELILLDYLETENPTAQGLIDKAVEEWGITRTGFARKLGYDGNRELKRWGKKAGARVSTEEISKVYEEFGFREEESRLELTALICGDHPGVSIDNLCDQAQAVLEVDPKEIPEEFEDNLIYQKMLSRKFATKDSLDKNKLSCALCDVLDERSGLTNKEIERRSDGSYDRKAIEKIVTGQKTPTIYKAGRGLYVERVERAKDLASVYTGNQEKIDRLGLLFQGIAKRQSREAILGQARTGEIKIGEAVRVIRRQGFISREDFKNRIAEEGSDLSINTLINLEVSGTSLRQEKDAKAVARALGFKAESQNEQDFADLLRGLNIGQVTLPALEKMVKKAMEPGSKLNFKHFIKPIQKFLRAESYRALGEMIKTKNRPDGLSGQAPRNWANGTCIDSVDVAEALADLIGFEDDTRENFIRIARGKERNYDQDIVNNLTAESTAQERSAAIIYIRSFAGYNQDSIPEELGVGLPFYQQFERNGVIGNTSYSEDSRTEFLREFAMLIPEEHAAQRSHLVDILSSPVRAVERA